MAQLISHLTLRLISLPTRRSLAAADDENPDDDRLLTIVAAHVDSDVGTAHGWGECSALNRAGYTGESARSAFATLGGPFDPQAHPMAASAIQMALLDVSLRERGVSLAEHVGTAGRAVPAGAVVGLDEPLKVLEAVEALVAVGYRRVKCKIAPDRFEHVHQVCQAFPEVEVQVDANASLTGEYFDDVRALAALGVSAVEQPFAVGADALSARLADACEIQIIADESIVDAESVRALGEAGAFTAVAVKPPKLGGLGAGLAVLDAVTDAGLGASIGGMLESGLGRHLLAALAPRQEFNLVGDLSPASQWLAADPFADITLRDGRIAAPSIVGIAGDPDLEMLDRFTIEQTQVPYLPSL